MAGAVVPPERLTGEGPCPSSLAWLLARSSSSQVVKLRASVPCWLEISLAIGFSLGWLIIGFPSDVQRQRETKTDTESEFKKEAKVSV